MITKMYYTIFAAMLSSFHPSAQAGYNQYFKDCQVTGSTTIYDYHNQTWFYTDSLDAERETLPASTFKILNSLIALETGALAGEEAVIPWDGTEYRLFGKPYPAWNRDMDLRTAFTQSAIWFYEKIAERVGRATYMEILNEVGYGNGDLSEPGTDFWNYGSFAVSPKNQIEFLVRLYNNDLPFSGQSVRAVKNIMVSEIDDETVWRDKTGWAQKDGQDIGWWVGYVTINGRVYFFATRISKGIEAEQPDFAACRKDITRQVLRAYINSHGVQE